MNTYFIKRFIARTAVVLSAAALFCGCSDDDETSTLHFDKPEVEAAGVRSFVPLLPHPPHPRARSFPSPQPVRSAFRRGSTP